MRSRNFAVLAFTVVLAVGIGSRTLLADEGGAGFWMPGQFGSLVAVQSAPGWAFPVVYNHPSATAGAGTSFRRGAEITAGLVYTLRSRTNHTDLHVFLFGRGWSGSRWSGKSASDLQKLE